MVFKSLEFNVKKPVGTLIIGLQTYLLHFHPEPERLMKTSVFDVETVPESARSVLLVPSTHQLMPGATLETAAPLDLLSSG